MPSPSRLRRLAAEHEEMCVLRDASSHLAFTAEGLPPTRYAVSLSCKGLCREDSEVAIISNHRFDMILPDDFPLIAPKLIWRTPIFHPNFFGTRVCMGDFWYPAWSLAEMCVALIEMVQYKTFNIYDPLDKQAAAWLARELEEHPAFFPVDQAPVRDLQFAITAVKGMKQDGSETDH